MRNPHERPEDFLIKYGQAVKEKLQYKRDMKEKEEMEGLSF